jgi:hypothetical protein
MNRLILTIISVLVWSAGIAGAQQQPPEPRPPDQRPPGERAPDQRPPEQRPPGERAPDQRPPDQRPPGQRPPDQRPPDPMRESLFPPDFVMRNAQQIGLTELQRESFMAEMRKVEGRFREFDQQIRKEMQVLFDLTKEECPDAEKVLAQLDKVLAAEREMKRTHMALMLGIKNILTPAQQMQLQELRPKPPGPPTPDAPQGVPPGSIRDKMQKVQAGMQQWKAAGRDPVPVDQIMREVDPLMKERKFAEAEAVLDRALEILGKDENK